MLRKSYDKDNYPRALKYIILMPQGLSSFKIFKLRSEMYKLFHFLVDCPSLLGSKHCFILFSAKRKRIHKSSCPEQCQQGTARPAEK